MTAFVEIAEIAPQQIWEGVVARAVHGDRVTLAVIELDADCLLPDHSHANEQVGILVSGSLVLRVGDGTRTMRPGTMWRIAADVPHEARTGPAGAVVVEVWSPPRADWRALQPEEPRAPAWPAV
jgi:quercetin dioxygenase-like cupin family protein